jgi:membrane protease YdiL (CAAX protease family)
LDRPFQIYLWLAFGITWCVGGLALLAGDIRPGGASPLHPLHYVAAFGPSIAGVVMAASTGGWAGVRRLLARVVPSWSSLPWYVAVLIGFPALNLVAARLLAPDFLARLPAWDRLLFLLPLTLITDTGPLGEEFGWRGFALPRLLKHRRPLAAALILGVIWWAWHLPTFFVPALSQHLLPSLLFMAVALAPAGKCAVTDCLPVFAGSALARGSPLRNSTHYAHLLQGLGINDLVQLDDLADLFETPFDPLGGNRVFILKSFD